MLIRMLLFCFLLLNASAKRSPTVIDFKKEYSQLQKTAISSPAKAIKLCHQLQRERLSIKQKLKLLFFALEAEMKSTKPLEEHDVTIDLLQKVDGLNVDQKKEVALKIKAFRESFYYSYFHYVLPKILLENTSIERALKIIQGSYSKSVKLKWLKDPNVEYSGGLYLEFTNITLWELMKYVSDQAHMAHDVDFTKGLIVLREKTEEEREREENFEFEEDYEEYIELDE